MPVADGGFPRSFFFGAELLLFERRRLVAPADVRGMVLDVKVSAS